MYKDEDEIKLEGIAIMYLNEVDGTKYLIEFAPEVTNEMVDGYADKFCRLLF